MPADAGSIPAKMPPSLVDEQFRLLDTNPDGVLTREELADGLVRSAGVSMECALIEADAIITEYCECGCDGLQRQEFTRMVETRYAHLRAIFSELDVSHSGRISEADVRDGLKRAQVPHLEASVNRVLSRLGANLDHDSHSVGFEHFVEATVLLPTISSQELLLTQAGVLPFHSLPPATTPTMIVTAGMINGMISRTMTAPMDRLRAVLATGRASTVSEAAATIYGSQGLRGFWASNLANVVQVAPENGIAFALNDIWRDYICADAANPTVPEKFLLGSTAGAAAMTLVYPMYVVQNRMAAAMPGQYAGLLDCMRRTGISFAGFGTSLVRVMPLKGIMLGGYSTLKDLVKDPETGNISTTMSLSCSAAAGGMAHAATYPLHVARTVLQQEVQPGARKYNGFVDVLKHRFQTHGIRGWYLGLPIWLCNRIPAVAIEFAVNEKALDFLKNVMA